MAIKGFNKSKQTDFVKQVKEAIVGLEQGLTNAQIKAIKNTIASTLKTYLETSSVPKKKRAPSAYILYSKSKQKDFSDLPVTERSKEIGALWRKLSDAKKKPFYDESEQLKQDLLKQ